jgi:AcrR family transcriptional regulator
MTSKRSRPRSGRPRLAASDWVDAALKTLAHKGIDHVKVEQLARDLKSTKGSFYWHFRDRNALLDAMLVRHGKHPVIDPREDNGSVTPAKKLRATMEAPRMDKGRAEGTLAELSLRLWAKQSSKARLAVSLIDKHRHESHVEVLQDMGRKGSESLSLAHVVQAVVTYLWQRDDLSVVEQDQIIETVFDLLGTDKASR